MSQVHRSQVHSYTHSLTHKHTQTLYISTNKLCGNPPQYAPAPCKLTFDLWPWEWWPSHVWRGLPLCQF